MAPKSIYRQPGAHHFQLVHRSLRDPLIHEPEASPHVLKAVEKQNAKKGKSRAELENFLSPEELAHDSQRSNIGEAAQFDIFYDDTEYNYMQHLRQINLRDDGSEGFLIEAPARKPKSRSKNLVKDLELPPESLPSTSEISLDYEVQRSIPTELSGLQPNMDPQLRQVLEALEDDDFVDDNLDDDYFDQIIASGQRNELDMDEYTTEDSKEEINGISEVNEVDSLYYGSDYDSEDGDTIGELLSHSVRNKRNKKKISDASGYSMSSSSMFRNDGLKLLDERFDQINKEYEREDDDLSDDAAQETEQPSVISKHLHLAMDNFLRMFKPSDEIPNEDTPRDSSVFSNIRGILKSDTNASYALDVTEHELEDIVEVEGDKYADKWDCNTIISSYSNLENRPRIIDGLGTKRVPRNHISHSNLSDTKHSEEENVQTNASNTHLRQFQDTTIGKKGESKEEKTLRKRAIKEERRARRIEKKNTKDQYSHEKINQKKIIESSSALAKSRKL